MSTAGTNVSMISDGWRCGNCNMWVVNGDTHTCTWQLAGSTAPLRLTDDEVERIARRVAELLGTKQA